MSDTPRERRQRRPFGPVTVLLAVVAAALALWLVATSRAGPPDPSMAPAATPGVPIVAPAPATEPSEPGTSSDAQRTAAAGAVADTPPAVVVLVVDEHGEPVAGARVQWTESNWDWSSSHLGYAPFDVEVELAHAPVTTTDGAGRASLACDAVFAFVWARAGDRFGQAQIDLEGTPAGPPRLEIRRDVAVRAIVRGPAGEAFANVLVAARFRNEEQTERDDFATIELGRSDADGRVQLAHAQCLDFWTPARPDLELAAIVLGARAAWVPCTLAGTDGAVELPCPPHGGVRVQLPPSAPDARPVATRLEPDEHDVTSSDAWDGLVECGDRRALVHPVALRRGWQLRAPGCVDLELAGPVVHGQTVEASMGPRADMTTLRVLDPAGAPLVRGWLESAVHAEHRDVTVRERHRTDAHGDLRLEPRERPVTMRLESAEQRAEATVEIPVLPGARAFATTVRLQPQQPVATGRVVDAATGLPVRAWLTLRTRDEPRARRARAARDGTFVVHGARPGPFSISADPDGYAAVTVDGTSEHPVELALVPASRLAVTLLVDPAVPLEEIWLHVEGSPSVSWTERDGRRDAVLQLPPAPRDAVLLVRNGGSLRELARVPSEQWQPVDGGFRTVVDLRGRLAPLTVAIQCDGRAVEAGVYLRDNWGDWVEFAGNDVRLAMPRDGTLDAIVVPEGHGVVATTLRAGHNVVAVPAPVTLRVRLRGAPPDVDAEALQVELWTLALHEPELARARGDEEPPPAPWPIAPEQLRRLGTVAAADDAPPGTWRLPHRGVFAAVPFVRRGTAFRDLVAHGVRIEVTELGSTRDALVDVPPEVVRAAWNELGGR
jgi:hypothetical protein